MHRSCGAGEELSVAPIMFYLDLARLLPNPSVPRSLLSLLATFTQLTVREEASRELESHPTPAHRSWLTDVVLSILLA